MENTTKAPQLPVPEKRPTPPAVNAPETRLPDEPFMYVLHSGETVTMIEGKGDHAIQATRMAGTDQGMWTPALISLLARVNDQAQPLEFYKELPIRDYMNLAAEVNGSFT